MKSYPPTVKIELFWKLFVCTSLIGEVRELNGRTSTLTEYSVVRRKAVCVLLWYVQ